MSERINGSGRMIGILGGMGPEATLDLFRHIINITPATKDQDHVRVLIYSNPKIPDRTEAITADGESPLPYLIDSAKILEKGGAGIIAMPCNQAHYYLHDIRSEISVPILDMTEETCREVRKTLPHARKVGLIAALGTVHSRIYDRAFSRFGIEVLVPSASDQQKVQAGIAHVKAGAQNRLTRETFQSIGRRLAEAGAEAVILGCTEIPLAFKPSDVNYFSIDTTRILAEAAVEWALSG